MGEGDSSGNVMSPILAVSLPLLCPRCCAGKIASTILRLWVTRLMEV